jgi:hypothetical protein
MTYPSLTFNSVRHVSVAVGNLEFSSDKITTTHLLSTRQKLLPYCTAKKLPQIPAAVQLLNKIATLF